MLFSLKPTLRLAPLFASSITVLLGMEAGSLRAQGTITLTCPPNITEYVDPNQCEARADFDIAYSSTAQTRDTFDVDGFYYWPIPAGVSQITVEAWGGEGNHNHPGNDGGGQAGYIAGNIDVSAFTDIYFIVGGGNQMTPWGGYNGGSDAGYSPCTAARGGGGGGASEVYVSIPFPFPWYDGRLLVAAGGGGAAGMRIATCGRGTGGGGGGGWYGGGGGAGWPASSTTEPTGGNQITGGLGGTSTYTGAAPYNNGNPGGMSYGGWGGDEQSSTQGGSTIDAADGGDGGGMVGDTGVYLSAQNWSGQSGAGGSNQINTTYVTPTAGLYGTKGVATVNAGVGRIMFSYPAPINLTYTSGHDDGLPFSLGVTTNTVVATQASATNDTCTFTVTVLDTFAPFVICPFPTTLPLDANCAATIPNFTNSAFAIDNCTPTVSCIITQSPAPSALDTTGLAPSVVTMYGADASGNSDSCSFQIFKVDASPPFANDTLCGNTIVYQPTTVECLPLVNFPIPNFGDNCPGLLTITGTKAPNTQFLTGVTPVTYTAQDQAGYTAFCSFTVEVRFPLVDSLIDSLFFGRCQGDTVMLVADSGYDTYQWSNNSINDTTFVTNSGNYILTVELDNCPGTDSVMIILNPAPMPIITQSGPSLCIAADPNIVSVQWYRQKDTMPPVALVGATSICYTPTQNLNHWVVVQYANGCERRSAQWFAVSNDEAALDPGFDLYPNPAASEVSIAVHQPLITPGEIRIVDLQGRTVYEESFQHLQGAKTLKLSNISAGTYMVEISTPDFIGRRKLIHID